MNVSSGNGLPGYSRTKGRKTVVVGVVVLPGVVAPFLQRAAMVALQALF